MTQTRLTSAWRTCLRHSRWVLPCFVLSYTVLRFAVVAGELSKYHVNVWVFAVLDIGTAWPYARALVSLMEAIGNRPARVVLAIGAWSALLAVTPYAYLLGSSRGMPSDLVMAICLFAVASAAIGLWFMRREGVPTASAAP
jgi:hypothetical protein